MKAFKILGFALSAIVCSSSIAEDTTTLILHEATPAEIEIVKKTSAEGSMIINVAIHNKIIDSKENERKFYVASSSTYQLVEEQQEECLGIKNYPEDYPEGYIYHNNSNNKLEFNKVGTTIEVDSDFKIVEIPVQTYLRLENKDSGADEVFCIFKLNDSKLVMAVDSPRMINSVIAKSVSISNNSSDISLTATETAINFNVKPIGWHGSYPNCVDKLCSIVGSKNIKSSVVFNFHETDDE